MTVPTGVEVTGTAQRAAWLDKQMPPVEQVREGLWSIPVPIPIPSLRYVLAYAFAVDGGVVVMDPGWSTADAYDGLAAGLKQAGFTVGDVRGLLITHAHPDHYGLAARVQSESGAWVGAHPREAETVPSDDEQLVALAAASRAGLLEAGMSPAEADELMESAQQMRRMMNVVVPDRLFADGEAVALDGVDLRAVWTPGHTPGHLCFVDRDRGLVFTGDHVLPRISPNISVHALNPATALGDYLGSLAVIADAAPADAEVLPAHEYRFTGLPERTSGLVAHHEERLGEVRDLLGRWPYATAWELSERLTWSRPWEQIGVHMRRAAVGETIAHLELLRTRGVVTSEDEDSDAGGTVRRWTVRA